MKKKILITLGAIVVLGGIGLVFVFTHLNSIVESFRPLILSQISQQLKQDVELEKISLSIYPETSIELNGLKLKDGPKLDSVYLNTKLSTILNRKLKVEKIVFKDLTFQKAHLENVSGTLANLSFDNDSDFDISGKLVEGYEFAVKGKANYQLATGKASLKGAASILSSTFNFVTNYNTNQGDFEITVDNNGIDLSKLSQLAFSKNRFKVTGQVEKLTFNARGNQASLPASIKGDTALIVSKGAVEGFNVFSKILDSFKSIPGIDSSISALIPDKYRVLLTDSSTAFDSLTLNSNILNNQLNIENITILHEAYKITGSGVVYFSGDFNIKTTFVLTPSITAGMIARQPKFKYLADDAGSISLPVVIAKKNGETLILPDISELARHAASKGIQDVISKQVQKLIPGGNGEKAKKLLESIF
jgi:hypothetical protein